MTWEVFKDKYRKPNTQSSSHHEAMVVLNRAGWKGRQIAKLFGITPQAVSLVVRKSRSKMSHTEAKTMTDKIYTQADLDHARTEATAEALARAGEAAQKAIRGNDVMLAAESGIERAMIAGRNLAAREIIDSIAALKETIPNE